MHDYFVPKGKFREEGGPYHPDYAIKLAKQGLYPMPVRLSTRRVGWMKSSILKFWEAQKTA